MRRNVMFTVWILLVTAAVGCGGGGDAPSVTATASAPLLTTSFTASNSSPGPNSVAMSEGTAGAGLVAIDVGVTGVTDVFAASFRVSYDPAVVSFENWSAGSFLEGSGNSVLYQVSVVTPGVVEIGVSCAGCPTGVTTSGTSTLVQMIFSAVAAGSSNMTFVASDLLDSQSPPTPISGISWDGGTLLAQ